ncbi:hypothetical protein [Glycocaulis sp.]|uniref:hypothetical protein n=1 Tax=Glycocaulis sp. TaxID=1969725 RepID=UPI003F70EF23
MRIVKAPPLARHLHDEQPGWVDRLVLRRKSDRPDFNRRMFDEDFARLFGFRGRERGNLFNVVSSDDELARKLLANADPRYERRSVDQSVRKRVEDIAQSLVRFGAAYYFLHDNPDSGEIRVNSFGSGDIGYLFGRHIQWVPKRLKRNWDREDEKVPGEIRLLDSAKVMRFVLPHGIKRMLSVQNRTLAVLDRHEFKLTEFQPQATHENPNPTNHFDFGVWRNTKDRVFYRSTRSTGWNGRKQDSSKRSDFFDCHRLIRFRRNQLILRDDIFRQLSSELSKVGRFYNAEFTVDISGTDNLPSIKDLNELEAKLTREEIGFTEVLDCIFER